MSIRFKCGCGKELDVPDETAGREAFCPGCRKSVPVPAESDLSPSTGSDEREASEFKPGALANLLGEDSGKGAAADPGKPDEGEAEAEAGPEQKKPESEEDAARRREERAGEVEEVAKSIPSPEKVGDSDKPGKTEKSEKLEKPEKPEKPDKSEKADEPERSEKAGPAGEEKPTADAGGKPGAAQEVAGLAPSGVEVLPDKIKFRCECGQKVAVRVPAPQSAGKCPRCKRTLTVPSVPGVTDKKPRASGKKRTKTSAKDMRHCAKCGRRIEDPHAAFCPRCGSPLENVAPAAAERKKTAELPASKPEPARPAAPAEPDPAVRNRSAREAADRAANLLRPPSRMEVPKVGPVPDMSVLGRPAGLAQRLLAFLLDSLAASGIGAGAYMIAGRAELGAALMPSVLAAVAAFALINEVIFATLSGGRSLGMLVAGIGVRNHEGQPAGFLLLLVRLLASVLLLIGAPLALLDSQGRTLHDIVCGTTVRRLSDS